MKAIRTYFIEGTSLSMHTSFLPDDDSLDLPGSLDIVAEVSPGLPSDVYPEGVFRMLVDDPEIPLDLRIQEMQHFLNTLKQMYYGV